MSDVSKSTVDTLPSPTIDDIIRRAIEDGDVLGKVASALHPTDAGDKLLCAQAVTAAIEDWAHETGVHPLVVLPAVQTMAFARVWAMGVKAREDRDQLDMFESLEIWEGAARYEAREAS
jgi:hypothetical protein